MKKNNGIVYVLSNQEKNIITDNGFKPLYKIGKTSRKDLNSRMKELYTTGVSLPFKCEYAISVDDCDEVEKNLHCVFGDYRVNKSREFFAVDLGKIIAAMSPIANNKATELVVTDMVNQELDNALTEDDKKAEQKVRKQRGRFNLYKMGLQDGTVLYYKKDQNMTCVVNGEHSVLYNGVETNLTRLTEDVCKDKASITSLWFVKDTNECLLDLYNDVQFGCNF